MATGFSPSEWSKRERATQKPELLYGLASEITLQNFRHIHLPGQSSKPDPPCKGGESGPMIWREQWQRICRQLLACRHILASAQTPSFTLHVFTVHTLYGKHHIIPVLRDFIGHLKNTHELNPSHWIGRYYQKKKNLEITSAGKDVQKSEPCALLVGI